MCTYTDLSFYDSPDESTESTSYVKKQSNNGLQEKSKNQHTQDMKTIEDPHKKAAQRVKYYKALERLSRIAMHQDIPVTKVIQQERQRRQSKINMTTQSVTQDIDVESESVKEAQQQSSENDGNLDVIQEYQQTDKSTEQSDMIQNDGSNQLSSSQTDLTLPQSTQSMKVNDTEKSNPDISTGVVSNENSDMDSQFKEIFVPQIDSTDTQQNQSDLSVKSAHKNKGDIVYTTPNNTVDDRNIDSLAQSQSPSNESQRMSQNVIINVDNDLQNKSKEILKINDMSNVSEQNLELRKLCVNLNLQLNNLEKQQQLQASSLQDIKASSHSKQLKLQSKIMQLEKSNKKLQTQNDSLQATVNDLQNENRTLKQQLNAAKWKNSTLDRKKLQTLSDKYQKASNAIEKLKDENQHLQQRCSTFQKRFTKQEAKSRKAESKLSKFKNEHIEQMEMYKTEVNGLISKNNDFKIEIRLIKQQLAESSKLNTNLKQNLDIECKKSTNLQTLIDKLHEQLKEIQDSSIKYQDQISWLETDLNVNQNSKNLLRQQSNELQTEKEKLWKQNQHLQKQMKNFEQQSQNAQMLLQVKQQEIDSLEQQIQSLNNKNRETEKSYQQKLLHFTQYAQDQMQEQQKAFFQQMNE